MRRAGKTKDFFEGVKESFGHSGWLKSVKYHVEQEF
jgi:hypothetical protein